MGFLTLGRRFLNNQNDIIDDRIDVVTRGTAGPHGQLCALPRSQVRSHPDEGLLRVARRLREQRGARRAADPPRRDRSEGARGVRRREGAAAGPTRAEDRGGDREVRRRTAPTAFRLRAGRRRARAGRSGGSPPAPGERAESRRADGAPVYRVAKDGGSLPVDPFDLPREEVQRWARVAIDTGTATLRQQVAALDVTHPGAPARAMVLEDKASPVDSAGLPAGDPGNRGMPLSRKRARESYCPHPLPLSRKRARGECPHPLPLSRKRARGD